ncbi:hypothetical protein ACFWM0_14845 [Streptomyces sp. NPDC058405]|uniref:hypothetical protein n=1 Tax=Streptomyces sp. NPDC058405 TaxID=3346482 RepID=UPI00364CA29E
MDQDQLYPLVMTTIGHALDGNSAAAASSMMEIGQQGDHYDVYGACCAFAEVGKAALKKIYGDRAPDPSRGDMWAMHLLKPGEADGPDLFASRFIVAYANNDPDATLALFHSALDASDDEYVSSVAALLAAMAGLSRLALDQPAT